MERLPCSLAKWRQHQHPRVSCCQIGIHVGSVAAIDIGVAADTVGWDTETVGTAGGDGVHQRDTAVAIEDDRFTVWASTAG